MAVQAGIQVGAARLRFSLGSLKLVIAVGRLVLRRFRCILTSVVVQHQDLFFPKMRGLPHPHPSCARAARIKRRAAGICLPSEQLQPEHLCCGAPVPSSSPRVWRSIAGTARNVSLRMFSGGVCSKFFFLCVCFSLPLPSIDVSEFQAKKKQNNNWIVFPAHLSPCCPHPPADAKHASQRCRLSSVARRVSVTSHSPG